MKIKADERRDFYFSITEVLEPKTLNKTFAELLDSCLINFDKLPIEVARVVTATASRVVELNHEQSDYVPPAMDEYGDAL